MLDGCFIPPFLSLQRSHELGVFLLIALCCSIGRGVIMAGKCNKILTNFCDSSWLCSAGVLQLLNWFLQFSQRQFSLYVVVGMVTLQVNKSWGLLISPWYWCHSRAWVIFACASFTALFDLSKGNSQYPLIYPKSFLCVHVKYV